MTTLERVGLAHIVDLGGLGMWEKTCRFCSKNSISDGGYSIARDKKN